MSSKTMEFTIPHRVGKAEARRRLEAGLSKVAAEHAGRVARVEERWVGDRLEFAVVTLGQRVSGHVDVEDALVRVQVLLPWLLAQLANRIRPQIEQQTRKMLEADAPPKDGRRAPPA